MRRFNIYVFAMALAGFGVLFAGLGIFWNQFEQSKLTEAKRKRFCTVHNINV